MTFHVIEQFTLRGKPYSTRRFVCRIAEGAQFAKTTNGFLYAMAYTNGAIAGCCLDKCNDMGDGHRYRVVKFVEEPE